MAAALDNMTVCPRTFAHARHLRPALEVAFASEVLRMGSKDERKSCDETIEEKIMEQIQLDVRTKKCG